ncbi:ABC transporter ATP-binding protein [Tumebacillus lipolyticus]|uniref:ABC transporter ATP-binding protein n=1 Tax=Tumebacillus lipolyticus TaxID=1280370 RepID=A0ABW5A0A6_9BACL
MGIRYLFCAMSLVWKSGKWWVISSIFLHILIGSLPLATIWVTKELVNSVSAIIQGEVHEYGPTIWLLLLEFGIAVVAVALRNLQSWLDQRMEVLLNHDLQKKISEKLVSVPLAYFENPQYYHHLTRINSGAGGRFLAPVRNTFEIFQACISLFSLLGYLLTLHWSFLLLSLLGAVPMLIVHAKFGQQKFWLMLHQTPVAREASYMSQLIMDRQGAKEIRLFGLGSYLINRWSKRYLKNAREALHLMRKQQGIEIALEAVTAVLYLGAAGVMIWLMRVKSMQIGDFVSMGQAVHGTQSSINQISFRLAGIFEETLYIRDFFQFIDLEEPAGGLSSVRGDLPFPKQLQEGIRFENVTFRYPDTERRVIEDVSFQIQPGEKIAIVGENGSGKTTLVKCLMGLYHVDKGQIMFDDLELRSIEERDLFRNITVIFQDFMKYSLTVRENIAFGDIDQLDNLEKLEEVARRSGVDRLVQHLEDGYATNLGRTLFDGEDVSGGQWQKIAIARALFSGGQIMILDEPTAALDPQAEMEVFRQFKMLTAGKTTLFISHRMAAARMADRIFVLKEGRLIESGTHEELQTQNGEYARMYRMQAQWYSEEIEGLQEAVAWRS